MMSCHANHISHVGQVISSLAINASVNSLLSTSIEMKHPKYSNYSDFDTSEEYDCDDTDNFKTGRRAYKQRTKYVPLALQMACNHYTKGLHVSNACTKRKISKRLRQLEQGISAPYISNEYEILTSVTSHSSLSSTAPETLHSFIQTRRIITTPTDRRKLKQRKLYLRRQIKLVKKPSNKSLTRWKNEVNFLTRMLDQDSKFLTMPISLSSSMSVEVSRSSQIESGSCNSESQSSRSESQSPQSQLYSDDSDDSCTGSDANYYPNTPTFTLPTPDEWNLGVAPL